MIALLAFACATPRGAVDPDAWYAAPGDLDVEESVAFTDQPYDFDGGLGTLLSEVYPTENGVQTFGPDDQFPAGACASGENDALPMDVTGIVTILPRLYFKTDGCNGDEEKYYTSFFLQDANGALFALGNGKAVAFDLGNQVTIRVRGAVTSYDLNMIYSWDLVDNDGETHPIYYTVPKAPLGEADIAYVRRVEGTVDVAPDTFGAFTITTDDDIQFDIQLDSDLTRRGVEFPVGSRIQVTGPVLFSYDIYSIVVMTKGQVQVLDEGDAP